jgi:hypothetical protein
MAPTRHEVNIAMEPYVGIVRNGRSLNDYKYLVQIREVMFDQLVWWGEALKAARQRSHAESGLRIALGGWPRSGKRCSQ